MHTVQLYINDQRIDLFNDEDISVVESIKNSRDIAKVFTTFSKQFTVPASKENNKIFKHFYNYHIVGGFDGRKTQPAVIEIDSITFRKGRLKLNGVKMKNNKAYAYNITFFGSVIDLKDILGEDKLTDLSALSSYTLGYSNSDILTALQAAPGETALPLVTANQQLYYDTTDTDEGTGNLYYDSPKIRGLNPKQLKYAIRLDKIIDAIETEYSGISFASDSFFKDPTKDIHKLYMWCHRKKDLITIDPGSEQRITFSPTFLLPAFNIEADSDAVLVLSAGAGDTFELAVSAGATDKYDLVIKKNGTIVKEYTAQTGSVTYSTGSFVSGDQFGAFVKTYDKSITFSGIRWIFKDNGVEFQDENANNFTYLRFFLFNVQEQIPEMKIIDFLSSLFKMFNLVAYIDDSGEVQVQPLDTFYTSTEHDITDFIDVSESEINVALPFKEIFFKYKDTKTILAAQHLQEIANVDWGGVEYTTADELYGDIYKVEPAFNHSKFERLLDLSDNSVNTDIQYGYYVDDNQNGYLGDPLIMYINQNQIDVAMSINNDGQLSQIVSSTNINMPSNLETLTDETSNNIHFNAELSEYNGLSAEETLFKRFYESYIQNIFDIDNRLVKLTAYLPKSKLIQGGKEIKLSDVVIVNGNRYRINSMSVNLTTGKTDFELINYYD